MVGVERLKERSNGGHFARTGQKVLKGMIEYIRRKRGRLY